MNSLIETADVVVANLPPETRKQMGLDYESLKKLRKTSLFPRSPALVPGAV